MKKIEDFKIQLSLLGLKPLPAYSIEDIFEKYSKLKEEDHVELWQYLEPEKIELIWPEVEYKPEASLQKRALNLGEEVVLEFQKDYPDRIDFEESEKLHHLVQHGKLGLQAFLFAAEKNDATVLIPNLAPIIEKFLSHIESLFEVYIVNAQPEYISRSLAIEEISEGQSFEDYVHGRLQPLSIMRSLYLEDSLKVRPLVWWVEYERYIPNLPE